MLVNQNRLSYLISQIAALPRSTKRLIMATSDTIGFVGCTVASALIITSDGNLRLTLLALVAWAVGMISMHLTGFYRSIVRFMGVEFLLAAVRAVAATSLAMLIVCGFLHDWTFAVRHSIVFGLLAFAYVSGSRTLARLMLNIRDASAERVIIYGAGTAGAHLASAIAARGDFELIAFVDDNSALHGAVINGCSVHPISEIESIIREFGVSSVLLALPSVTRRRRRQIISRLEQLPVHVQTMPNLNDLILGVARVDDIRDVDIEDLLGRDVVAPIPELLGPHITGRSVMVTGAGGSIGSELSMQILKYSPKSLILLEISEAALYSVDQSLQETKCTYSLETEIVPLIGSAHHKARVTAALEMYDVNTIYHAAAYKHVPLVEQNMLEGVHNNVFGTLHTAQAAVDAGVESFVLVSTDKAVKPTNVMGATKRFAELILHALDQQSQGTRFSAVRFGNVLASSGSVVPRFREQIRAGGPVTVTHPEIYRYFMTIPEAASLVLQAGAMSQGGEVFVLDMGEPVRIVDLAEKLIHLMGLTIRTDKNPDGDIEIEFTGLRPAEKLYEELLIGSDVAGTQHPRIMQAKEHGFSWAVLEAMLESLWDACKRQDCGDARDILLEGVAEYEPTEQVEDLVWRQRYGHIAEQNVEKAANVTRLEPKRGTESGSETGT